MDSLVKDNLQQIKEAMRTYGVTKAYLFGSAATDNMNNNSDVDFLVSFREDLSYTLYGDNFFSLLYALQDILKKDVDIIAEETISNPYLLQRINSQKILVL